jgi:hypothetical protein
MMSYDLYHADYDQYLRSYMSLQELRDDLHSRILQGAITPEYITELAVLECNAETGEEIYYDLSMMDENKYLVLMPCD